MPNDKEIFLNEELFKDMWKKRATIFSKKQELVDRFVAVTELVGEILKPVNKITIDNDTVKIGDNTDIIKTIKLKNGDQEKNPKPGIFGPAEDNLPQDERFKGIIKQAGSFYNENTDDYKRVVNILSLLGGFDFETKQMVDAYRIISNASKPKEPDDFSKTLTSYGQSSHPSSHFADNTYFFNIMQFLQNGLESSAIALRYPLTKDKDNNYKGSVSGKQYNNLDGVIADNEQGGESNKQREILKCRFPLKFFWMWANKDEVLHPFSLMAFRNFVKSEFGKKILKELKDEQNIANLEIDDKDLPKAVTNADFAIFTEIWKKFSEKVVEKIKGWEPNEKVNSSEISKLISVIMVEDTDMKNIEELLEICKQIIIYGSPGTGKTYSAMEVVKEFINSKPDSGEATQGQDTREDDDKFDKEYRFSTKYPINNSSQQNLQQQNCDNLNHGLYEIIQFHPSYTYHDFIGGIFPNINNNAGNINYELKEGIFKRFCDVAGRNKEQRFVFIIDEINRANLPEVFGELLYALEYRNKIISIPYFGEFSIPDNVYIIGTMNNVDKSLVTFDLALRRRFGFYALKPDMGILQAVINNNITNIEAFVDRCAWLNRGIINKPLDEEKAELNKIALDLGENYQIGHAYFLKVKQFVQEGAINPNHLQKLWEYHIEPLLEEYLGMSLESEEIKKKLGKLKEEFTKLLKAG